METLYKRINKSLQMRRFSWVNIKVAEESNLKLLYIFFFIRCIMMSGITDPIVNMLMLLGELIGCSCNYRHQSY